MKALHVIAVAGSLLAMGALPALAHETAPPATPEEHSAIDDFAAKKDAYLKDAQSEMARWRKHLDVYSKQAATKGQQIGKQTDKDLRDAWQRTKAASQRLGKATATGWDQAKASFEQASRHLQQEWRKHMSQ